MEKLDEVLVSRRVDLDDNSFHSNASNDSLLDELRSTITDDWIQSDALSPHIVTFTKSYNPYRKRKLISLLTAIALSIYGMYHFSKLVTELSHEAPLDIESKEIRSVGGQRG